MLVQLLLQLLPMLKGRTFPARTSLTLWLMSSSLTSFSCILNRLNRAACMACNPPSSTEPTAKLVLAACTSRAANFSKALAVEGDVLEGRGEAAEGEGRQESDLLREGGARLPLVTIPGRL